MSTAESALRYDRTIDPAGTDSLAAIVRLIEPGSTVLDLGAATGTLGAFLARERRCTVDGVELDPEAARLARPAYRKLLELDLDQADVRTAFAGMRYDAVVCADVLEHLRDPGRTLDQIKGLLSPGGRCLISIPHVGYVGVVAGLLTGDFQYRPTGILDRTHLRFFTRRSLLDFLQQHGFGARSLSTIEVQPHESEFAGQSFDRIAPEARDAMLTAPDALAYQFIVEAVPGPHAPGLAATRDTPELRFGVQLYWAAAGQSFEHTRSVSATAPMGDASAPVELPIPAVAGRIDTLRLDVADRPGYVRLQGLRLVSARGEVLWQWDGTTKAFRRTHQLFVFAAPATTTCLATGADPWIELDIPAAALARSAGGRVVAELGWPMSPDYLLASRALSNEISRVEDQLHARIAALEAKLAVATTHADLLHHRVQTLERASRLKTLLRATRRELLRQVFELEVHPNGQLRRAGEEWESTGTAAAFELTSPRGRLPSGWCRIVFELSSDVPIVNPPALYCDVGDGFRESTAVPLPRPRDGVIDCVVKLPERSFRMRFDPIDRPGRFRLGALRAQEMSKPEAALRLAAPVAREIVREPGRTRLALGKAIETLRKDGVQGLKRRVRERTHATQTTYAEWIEQFDKLSGRDIEAIRARIAVLPEPRTRFSIVMPVYETPERWLTAAIESVRAQLYPDWELCIADDASPSPHVRAVLEQAAASDPRIKVAFRPQNGHISEASNSALSLATGDYVVLLDHDDALAPHALYLVAEELAAHPDADLLYSDEDKIDESGRRYDPYFKPEWDPELFASQNYFSHLGVYRRSLVEDVGGFRKGYEGSQDYDLVLRCLERTTKIRHVPHVLYHWRSTGSSTAAAPDAKAYAHDAGEKALRDHFATVDSAIEVGPGRFPTTYHVRRPVPQPPPLVTIVIPTRDGADVLRRCLDSIFARTTYSPFEVLVVDNQSSAPDALAYFDELRRRDGIRVLSWPHPFNYSAINNFAAKNARGEILCLLNNDVEIISAEWLKELVSHACRPDVGAVGARLLYPNGTIQHAGVISGLYGVAAHVHRYLPREAPGYFSRAVLTQRMTIVTGACLAVRRSVFEKVGGLDEQNLPIAFNDVDFCLRCAEAGYTNIYTPYAELFHYESYSRGPEDTPEKRARFQREADYIQRRWKDVLDHDPAYNPNLSLSSEQFELAWPPRAPKPWKRAG